MILLLLANYICKPFSESKPKITPKESLVIMSFVLERDQNRNTTNTLKFSHFGWAECQVISITVSTFLQ